VCNEVIEDKSIITMEEMVSYALHKIELRIVRMPTPLASLARLSARKLFAIFLDADWLEFCAPCC